jgi:hypothetical protein
MRMAGTSIIARPRAAQPDQPSCIDAFWRPRYSPLVPLRQGFCGFPGAPAALLFACIEPHPVQSGGKSGGQRRLPCGSSPRVRLLDASPPLEHICTLTSVAGGLAQPILLTCAIPARRTLTDGLGGVTEGVGALAFGSGTLEQG